MAIAQLLAQILAAQYGRDVRQSIHDAIGECYDDVSTAKTLATDATNSANTAATNANEKATLANTKAGLADAAATNANGKATLADTKAGLADAAATNANGKATLADTKAGLADAAAINANEKATLADTKAGLADAAATNANEKATLADTKAGLADAAAINANNAATNANTKAGLADAAAINANDKATLANNAATLANTKAGLADAAAINANAKATLAQAAADRADQIEQPYIHIMYSVNNPTSDGDMITTPSNWIGVYSGASQTPPTGYTSYEWFKFKGEPGDVTNHIHGNITNDGKIGSSANKPIITGVNGALQAGDFGTGPSTFCEGNDPRLSDVRPASDVYPWAKAAEKPSYTPAEVGALALTAKAADSDKLDGVHLADIRLGQNILHNWDFRNPVNQRAVSGSVSANGYFYDRWIRYDSPSTSAIILNAGYITLPVDVLLGQNIEGLLLGGKTVTLSIMLSDGSIHTHTNVFPSSGSPSGTLNSGSDSLAYYKFRRDPTSMHVQIIPASASLNIVCVKLELGTVSTLHLDPPMDHAVELPKCMRFFTRLYRMDFIGIFTSTSVLRAAIILPTSMRITPSVGAYLARISTKANGNGGNPVSLVWEPSIASPNGGAILATASEALYGVSAGDPGALTLMDNMFIYLSADL